MKTGLALGMLCLFALASPAKAAPTVAIGTVSGNPGASVNLPVTFTAGSTGITAMQFDLAVPSGLTYTNITAGSAATAAGKTVSASLNGSSLRVIVFGLNQTSIGSGSLGTVQLSINSNQSAATLSVAISGITSSDLNGAGVATTGTNGSVTVTVSTAPIAWWKLDETSGNTAADSSGSGNIGTRVNGPAWTSAGRINGAITLGGDDQYIAANSTLFDNLGSLTLAMWVKPSASGGTIFTDHDGCETWESIWLDSGQFRINSSNSDVTRQVIDFTPPPVGAWTHLAAVWTGTQISIYQNGVRIAGPVAASNAPFDSPAAPILGGVHQAYADCWGAGVGDVADEFPGLVDDLRVYRRALTAAELLALFNAAGSPAPVVSSAGSATGQVGFAFSYQITASNNPTSFGATGLPGGVSVNTTNGLLSGTPSTAGTTNVTLSATNAGGTGTKALSLLIYSACDTNTDGSATVIDVQQSVNQALGISTCKNDINRDTLCNVIDVQRIVVASLGSACVSP